MNPQTGLGKVIANQIDEFVGYLCWLYSVEPPGYITSFIDELVMELKEKGDHINAPKNGG